MLAPMLGTVGFALFILYDFNSILWCSRWLRCAFAAGIVLIFAATVLMCVQAFIDGAFAGIGDVILLCLALLALLALIYSLFFALPFDKTYVSQENGRKVYTCGLYAACRHPGILFFFVFYLLLGLAALPTEILVCGMYFSVLNLLYAFIQDRYTFPKSFTDYDRYRSLSPFLIPNKASIKRCISTWGYSYEKEGEL